MEDDDYIIDLSGTMSTDTITIDSTIQSDYTVDTIDISGITLSIDKAYDNIDWSTNITLDRVMFEDDMPDPQEIKRMCEEYPALEKVYENFKTVYKMVEQDWRGKQDEEPPF